MSKKIDISLIITAHNEGLLAHKTMLSAFKAIEELEKEKISYEIIVHIDNGDEYTKEYFKRYENDKNIRIFNNNFGDLSSSRIFSVKKAKGEYIAFADADDLYSSNWLISFYNQVKGKKDTIAHFNYILTFGGWNTILEDLTDLNEKDEFLYAFDSNVYGSPCMLHKDIFSDIEQRANIPPFGYEDWQWYVDTMAKGYKHKIAKGTVLFYRRDPIAKPSLLSGQVNNRAVLSKSDFFDFDILKKKLSEWSFKDIEEYVRDHHDVEGNNSENKIKYLTYKTLVFANKFSIYKKIRNTIKEPREENTEQLPVLPDDLIKEWKDINKIEKLLYPDHYILKNHFIYYLPNKKTAKMYLGLVNGMKKCPDTLVFLPWLNHGGADKLFINTFNELAKQNKDWHISLVQTESSDSPWQNKLSTDIDFVKLSDISEDIGYEKQIDIFASFIVQNNIKRLIIANSMFGYNFILRYKKLLEYLDIKIYVYAFNENISEYGRIGGYIHEQIPLIYNSIYKVITDNSLMPEKMIKEHGYTVNKHQTHYQYVEEKVIAPVKKDKEKLKILWASRICYQKMPEILAEINKRISSDFTIDVYGTLEDFYDLNFIKENNLNYKGVFNGINSIPTNEYDLYLYTSNSDGMPNILLEIATKGLPIIAPNVGGVGDFIINNETGILIDDYKDVDTYLKAIEKMKDSNFRYKLAKNSQELLKDKYSKNKWKARIKEIFDR